MNHLHRHRICLCLAVLVAGLLETGNVVQASEAATHQQVVSSPFPTRMRGVNCPLHGLVNQTGTTIARFASWGVNTLRINFSEDARLGQGIVSDPPTEQNPLAPYRRSLKIFDRVLAACAKYHIGVILSPSSIYGRKLDYFWKETEGLKNRNHLLALWDALAPRYQDNPTVIAFELLNEPNFKKGDEHLWRQQMLPQTLAVVRKHTQTKWVVVGPGPWGFMQPYASEFKPLSDPRVIYTYHYYSPHCYTHQGIRHYKRDKDYPGTYREFPNPKLPVRDWGIASIRADARIAKSFCDRYNVRMLVGEFGVVRWAPHGDKYLADCIKVFEEMGFDWLFHSPAGWNGWNPTFDAKDPPGRKIHGGKKTAKLKVLLHGWSLNHP